MKTHTEIVKEKLKGCGKKTFHSLDGYDDKEFCGENGFCPNCKATLSGMQTSIESELEFLENEVFHLKENKNVHPLKNRKEINVTIKNMEKRITDCKNALKLIEEAK